MPTNEQRRATAKRKLERQLERRAAKERKRRIYTIVGSSVAALVVIGAVVATVVITNHDSGSQTRRRRADHHADAPPPAPPAAGAGGSCPPFAAPADLGAELPVPGVGGRRPASRSTRPAPARCRPTRRRSAPAWRPIRATSACSSTTPSRRARSTASPAWPSRASSTTRPCHRLTTRRGAGGAAVRRPDRRRHRRSGLPVRQRVPDRPVPARRPRAAGAGRVSARHAGHGQRRAGHQRQPVLPGVQGLAAAAELHGVRHHRRDRPGHAGQDRRGGHGRGGQDGKPKRDVQVKSIALD